MECPVVSICIFAYNHEQYIAQGIESVLSQKTNYSYVLYVFDDFSSDGTVAVVQKYVILYPEIVKLVRNTENHGINYQFEKAMLSIHTKYACLTGGDDYWIDEYKLQKQIDFLESHSDYTMVHTNCKMLYVDTNKMSYKAKDWYWNMPENRLDRLISLFLNRMKGGYPLMTSSCYRTEEIERCIIEQPEIIHSKVVGEGTTILSAIALYGGLIGYLPEPTVVYRVRKGSLSHKKTPLEQLTYLFSYTELRLQILQKMGIERSKYLQVATDLFKTDIHTAILNGTYYELRNIVNDCSLDEKTKNLFYSIYKQFHTINKLSKYKFILKLLTWWKVRMRKIINWIERIKQ